MSGAPVYNTYSEHNFIIDNVQFSSDGKFLISRASGRQNVNFGRNEVEYFIWETSSWTVVQRITAFDNNYDLAAISDDASGMIFFEYGTNTLTIWDNSNATSIWQIDTFDFAQDLAYTSDGEYLIASTVVTRRMAPPDNILVLDPATGDTLGNYNGIDSNRIIGLPILPGETADTLRLIHNDGTVTHLNLATGDESTIGTVSDASFINGISENGRFIVAEDFETPQFRLYDLNTATEVSIIAIEGFVRGTSISNDGQYIAYTTEDPETGISQIKVVNTASQTIAVQFKNVPTSFPVRAHLFADNGIFAYYDKDSVVHLIDSEIWQETQQLTGFLESIHDMEYNSAAQRLAVGGETGAVMVWDTETGAIVFQLDSVGNTALVALTPSADGLATGNEFGQIRFWRLFNPTEALAWVENNRSIMPLSCADRLRYGLDCE